MKALCSDPSGSMLSDECSSPNFIYGTNKLDTVQKQYEAADLFEMVPDSDKYCQSLLMENLNVLSSIPMQTCCQKMLLLA